MSKRVLHLPRALALASALITCGAALASATVDERPPKLGSEAGEAAQDARYAACHQADGQGLKGRFPPLAASSRLAEQPLSAAIETVLKGMAGPIEVDGERYDGVMPAMSHLPDAKIAAILTHVYSTAWNNPGHSVTAEQVAEVRAASGTRADRAQGEVHPGASR
jgi:nitrite reductase (NO-forming) / hydroxylamine reductase